MADDEFLLPKPVIVLLIMFGACAITILGYGIHKTFGFGPNPNEVKPITVEQVEYMAEVRVRGMDALAREGKLAWHEDRKGGMRRQNETVYSVGTSSVS